jgi:hypothetical protein
MKFLQVVVFIASAWFLIWVRDSTPDPQLREPLSNGYLIALLSAGAAFVVTITIIGISELLARIRDARRRRLGQHPQGLQEIGNRRRPSVNVRR